MAVHKLSGASTAMLVATMMNVVSAVPARVLRQLPLDPFAPIDPQNWVSVRIVSDHKGR
jgi:ABC-type taurine transport system ATPase subunit